MKTVRLVEAAEIANPHNARVRKLYDTEHAQVMVIDPHPGESLKRHITPVDVFFYVLAGEGMVHIGDEEVMVSADTLIESPARIPHRLSNPSQGLFRVMVGKVPRPTESTRLL